MGNLWSSSSETTCPDNEQATEPPAPKESPTIEDSTTGPQIATFYDVLHLDCFNSMLTLGSCLLFMYWGALRLYQFKKNSVVINPRYLKAPLTFKVQTFLQGLMTYFCCIDIFAILLFIQQKNECQYILSILSSLSLLISWVLVYMLTQIETTCKFSTEPPIYEHNQMLQLFWLGRFLIEIVNTLWLFWEQRLTSFTSISCFYLIIRVIMVEIILVLGLQAPGLYFPTYQYYNYGYGGGGEYYDDEMVQAEEQEGEGGIECGSGLSIAESADECSGFKENGDDSINGINFGGPSGTEFGETEDEPEIKEFIQEIVESARFYTDSSTAVQVKTNADQLPTILTKFNTWKRLTIKFMWPENNANVKLLGLTYAAILGTQLILNLWDDVNYKYVVDSLNPLGASTSKEDGEKPTGFHWGYLAIGFLIAIANYGIRTTKEQLMYKMTTSNQKKLQVQLFEKAHYQSLRWHLESYNQEQIVGLIYSPFGNFMYSIGEGLNGLLNLTDMILALIYITLVYNQQITILFILTVIYTTALDSILNVVFERREYNYSRADLRYSSSQNQFSKAIGSIYCYETVKYFSNEDYEINRFKQALDSMENQRNLHSFIKNWILQFGTWFVQEFGVFIAKLFCLWALVNSSNNNCGIEITAGDFIFLTTILNMYSRQFSRSSAAFETLGWAMAGSETLETILESIPEVRDEPNAPDFNFKCGEIEFKNVGFYYEQGKQVLKNVNFKIGCGKTLAIVGPSGSGKSTIMKLLFRFYDTTEGEIIIDGQSIKKVKQKSLRQVIGVVPQDCMLLNDTIWNNLQYAKVTANEEDLNRAAKEALIYDTIVSFPTKYDTQVGQRGQRLSGGEKQRVAIARVLLKNPPIFLLDEATSSLDTLTERKIHESLKKASENRTTIIVAHRLSTIVNADHIIVLKQGTVIESGNHQQLMNVNGTYAELWKAQTTAESKSKSSPASAEPNVN